MVYKLKGSILPLVHCQSQKVTGVELVGMLLTLLSPPTVTVATGRQAPERRQRLKGNKFHDRLGQAMHYGDVTGQARRRSPATLARQDIPAVV